MDQTIHVDMEESVQKLLEHLDMDDTYKAICQGNPESLQRLQTKGSIQIPIDLRQEAPLGKRQVESLLRFVVSPQIERAMEDAEADNLVYDALGEHRILGKVKKPKKPKTGRFYKPGRSGSLPPGNETVPGVTTR